MHNFFLDRSVRTWDEYQKFERFIFAKYEDGQISHVEMKELMFIHAKTLSAASGPDSQVPDPSFGPVLKMATHLVRQALLKQHPEFESELRNYMGGMQR